MDRIQLGDVFKAEFQFREHEKHDRFFLAALVCNEVRNAFQNGLSFRECSRKLS